MYNNRYPTKATIKRWDDEKALQEVKEQKAKALPASFKEIIKECEAYELLNHLRPEVVLLQIPLKKKINEGRRRAQNISDYNTSLMADIHKEMVLREEGKTLSGPRTEITDEDIFRYSESWDFMKKIEKFSEKFPYLNK
jgi:hypothetical protein